MDEVSGKKTIDEVCNPNECDRIKITLVRCWDGLQKPLVIKRNEYPQFDNLSSKLITVNFTSGTSYIIIKLYCGENLLRAGCINDYGGEILEAINQAKEYLAKK